MNQDRRVIFQLLAAGRIDAAQAERLLGAVGADREALWAMVVCIALVGLTGLREAAPQLLHLLRDLLAANLPALRHFLASLPFSTGGLS